MQISILEEHGLESALMGIAFSYEEETSHIPVIPVCTDKNYSRAVQLAKLDKGHNKFLEQVQVWSVIRASMAWWKQMDTYRVGITKSSKSTMHTLMKSPLKTWHFTDDVTLETVRYLENTRQTKNFTKLIAELPMGYLQTRLVTMSYKNIRHIITQRREHKLPEWQEFCSFFTNNLKHPELLGLN